MDEQSINLAIAAMAGCVGSALLFSVIAKMAPKKKVSVAEHIRPTRDAVTARIAQLARSVTNENAKEIVEQIANLQEAMDRIEKLLS